MGGKGVFPSNMFTCDIVLFVKAWKGGNYSEIDCQKNPMLPLVMFT